MNNNNPFFRQPKEVKIPEEIESNFFLDLYHSLLQESAKIQQKINGIFAQYFQNVDDLGLYGAFLVLSIAFLYGTIHALGPGHGKTVVTLYCVSKKEPAKKAFKLGFLIAVIHGLSALFLTYIIYFLLDVVFAKTFSQTLSFMQLLSGVIIIFVGFYMIYEHKKELHSSREEEEKFRKNRKRGAIFIALSVGLVPCPGVMTILLFSIALEKYLLGVASAFAMSIGMGLGISIVGFSAIKTKEVSKIDSGKLETFLSYFGSIMLILLGSFLIFIS